MNKLSKTVDGATYVIKISASEYAVSSRPVVKDFGSIAVVSVVRFVERGEAQNSKYTFR